MIICPDRLKQMNAAYRANPALRAAELAMGKQNLDEVIFDNRKAAEGMFIFNHELETLPVTNQMHSGRCWLFAALNLFREIANKKLNMEQFELSQNFIAYYDKLEKANYFLDSVMKTLDLYKDDRLVNYIVSTGVQDGGQWDMMASLVKKYGLVPKSVFPETYMSSNTRSVNRAVNIKLCRAAAILRRMHKEGRSEDELKKVYADTLADVHGILTAAFGQPPEKFDFEYRDKDKNFHRIEGLTPQTFWEEYINFPFDDYVSLINSPTDDKPYNRRYTVRFLGNVVEGDPICYLNTGIDTIKKAVMQAVDRGESVWFGSDVGWFMDRSAGALLNDINDYSPIFGGMEFRCSKEDKLDYRMSAMNHAMTITGYHEVNGRPVRWKIQNSWGDEKGSKGYYMMNDEWFDDYVYQAVVKKSSLPEELLNALDTEPIVLEPWDPMGTLAD